MKILVVNFDIPWPLHSGGRQRTFALIRTLARRHEVTLAALADPSDQDERIAPLRGMLAGFLPIAFEANHRLGQPTGTRMRRLCATMQDLARTPLPFEQRLKDPENGTVLAPHFSAFDAAVCRHLRMMPFLDGFPRDCIVLDIDDVPYVGLGRSALNGTHGWGAPLVALEMLRTYFYTHNLTRHLARTLLASPRDMARFGCPRRSLVPNGIDLPDPARLQIQPRPHHLIFVGSASYDPNVEGLRWFLRHVWPRVRQELPAATLQIVGRDANARTLPFVRGEGVEMVSDVPETTSWFAAATLSIAPLLNGMGTRLKILESLACGRPVVSTRIGAEGLEDIGEFAGLIRVRGPQAMAARIVALLRDPSLALELGSRGRAWVEGRYTWDATTAILASDFEHWIGAARATPTDTPTPSGNSAPSSEKIGLGDRGWRLG